MSKSQLSGSQCRHPNTLALNCGYNGQAMGMLSLRQMEGRPRVVPGCQIREGVQVLKQPTKKPAYHKSENKLKYKHLLRHCTRKLNRPLRKRDWRYIFSIKSISIHVHRMAERHFPWNFYLVVKSASKCSANRDDVLKAIPLFLDKTLSFSS